ncbi:MAG TPA: TonB-dependent receptor [Bacteroidales bacterium]|nr:TonB-dependent receptor [Bacteroidales bacterium]
MNPTRWLAISFLILATYSLYAAKYEISDQNTVTITGRVTTDVGHPVEFALVYLKNTRFGAVTNTQGEFSFEAPSGTYTLVVQSLIHKPFEKVLGIPATNRFDIPLIVISEEVVRLDEVVVTGQFIPQSLNNSVYKVRTINQQTIARSGATEVRQLLERELGVSFRNDLVTGESDIQLMGMSGQNVKVLLDGLPLIDRGSRRQSLSQVDLNQIERIEIVEGPLSVQYGTDALAGVINLISKRNHRNNEGVSLSARVIEETAGNEYSFGVGEGVHNLHFGIGYTHRSGLIGNANFTRNEFGGWQGNATGRARQWRPRNQLMGGATVGFRNDQADIWYRINYLDETIYGPTNPNPLTNIATDLDFLTTRFTHQLQGRLVNTGRGLVLTGMLSYQDLKRRSLTTTYNPATGDRRLAMGQGDQDVSLFDNLFARFTASKRFNNAISVLTGVEYRLDHGSGDRIQGSPNITDVSAFVSAEWVLGHFNLRPGLRFSHNSVYAAPPVIPSINTLININEWIDFRASYAKGFRAPALRELHFWFFNANHSIKGNTNLKAENSDSFLASLTFNPQVSDRIRIRTSISGFYNTFNDMIAIGVYANDPSMNTFINIDRHKTTGGTFEASINAKAWQAGIGVSHIGRFNRFSEQFETEMFHWSPEFNANLLYNMEGINTSFLFSYKFTGKRPFPEIVTVDGNQIINTAYVGNFSWADITLTKTLHRFANLQIGARNIFNVIAVQNTAMAGGGHGASGPMQVSYGRSWFAGLVFNFD